MISVITRQILPLTIAGIAVLMDLIQMQVKNSWILCSLIVGFIDSVYRNGWKGILIFLAGAVLPAAVLGGLFYFRMLGAGDVKTFCALGGIMGPACILHCIWYAFLAGAILSAGIMVMCGEVSERLQYLTEYIKNYISTGKRKPYYKAGLKVENIHFTIPIFMSVMLYAGGIY